MLTEHEIQALTEELHNHRVELSQQQAELERTLLELEKARLEFDELRDNAPVAYILHETDGFVFETNRRARDLLGLQPCQETFSIYDLFSEKVSELYSFHIDRLKSLGRSTSIEFAFDSTVRKEMYILAESSFLETGNIQTIMIDVSSRKASERVNRELDSRLLHTQKMEILDRVSGGLAHDFNNILQVLVLQSEVTEQLIDPSNQGALESARQMSETANRGVELTRRLLTFSRKRPLEKVRGDINSIIQKSEDFLTQSLGMDWELRFDLSPNRLGVWIDPVQFEQALLNLCLNAKDAMPGGGRIEVTTDRKYLEANFVKSGLPLIPGYYAVVSVRDNGHGIPEHLISKVFEPYFTTKEVGRGTGLGLPIVHSIMKQHGGGIEIVRSDKFGTTIDLYIFSFHLPEVSENDDRPEESLDEKMNGVALVCDDEPAILKLLTQSLEQLGLTVYSSRDGESAIDLISQLEHIDLLLTDVVMPGKCGRTVCSTFRKKFSQSAAILMSGHGDSVLDEKYLRENNATFLPKPFNFRNLREKLGLELISR